MFGEAAEKALKVPACTAGYCMYSVYFTQRVYCSIRLIMFLNDNDFNETGKDPKMHFGL